jgi:microcystin-dependent protein
MVLKPIWLQNLSYAAQLDRSLIEALVANEGVTAPRSMRVIPTTSPSMSLTISTGSCYIKGDDSSDQGMYYVTNTTAFNTSAVVVPAAGYHRIDSICVGVNDPDGGGAAGDNAVVTITQGTPVLTSATPSAPATGSTKLLLATVLTTSATSAISTVTDQRALCGGIDHIGSLKAWSPSTAMLPSGWLICQGQAISRTTYADLFFLIGTQYGAGDGTTTFNIPNLAGRGIVGTGTGGYASPTARAVADAGGSEIVQITNTHMPAHAHVMNHNHANSTSDYHAGHQHNFTAVTDGTSFSEVFTNVYSMGGGGKFLNTWTGVTVSGGGHSHVTYTPTFNGSTQNTGSGSALNTMNPYLAIPHIIRVA